MMNHTVVTTTSRGTTLALHQGECKARVVGATLLPSDDMGRVVAATGAAVQSTVSDLEAGGKAACLGSCGLFEEKQVGAERFNVFTGCSAAKSATLVLRGGSDAFVDEAERSLHDAVMIVRRAIKNAAVVAGGGAIDMELSR